MVSPCTNPPPKLLSTTWQHGVGLPGFNSLSGVMLLQVTRRDCPRTSATTSSLHASSRYACKMYPPFSVGACKRTRRDRISPVYRDLWNRNMEKDTLDTRWVASPIRQRLVTSRKRALRSRSVRAARSVCSEYRSRVIESRKFDDCWGLSDRVRGDSIVLFVMDLDRTARPGSESRAKVYGGILGTCEGLQHPAVKTCRNGMKPREQRPGSEAPFPCLSAAKQRKAVGYRRSSSRRESGDRVAGRLSRLIVVFESRETLLRRSL